jgi:hypothetical protein
VDTGADDSRSVYARVYGTTTAENSYTLSYTFSEV